GVGGGRWGGGGGRAGGAGAPAAKPRTPSRAAPSMRYRWTAVIGWCLVLAATPATAEEPPRPVTAQEAEFFEARVRPLLVEHCVECHGPAKQSNGLRPDSRAGPLRRRVH